MTLSAMRKALQTTGEENSSVAAAMTTTESDSDPVPISQPSARLPPDSRGVKESRSSIINVDLSPPDTPSRNPRRRGTLTFANSVRELRRAGSSRVMVIVDDDGGIGGDDSTCHPAKTLPRTPPRRAQSCKQG